MRLRRFPISMRALLLLAIRAYQRLAPSHVRGACRHFPSCSEYAREAIARQQACLCFRATPSDPMSILTT